MTIVFTCWVAFSAGYPLFESANDGLPVIGQTAVGTPPQSLPMGYLKSGALATADEWRPYTFTSEDEIVGSGDPVAA